MLNNGHEHYCYYSPHGVDPSHAHTEMVAVLVPHAAMSLETHAIQCKWLSVRLEKLFPAGGKG